MILIKEDMDFFLLYSDSAQFIGNGNMEKIRSILRRYAKRAGGNRMHFNSSMISELLKENEVKVSVPKIRVLGKKKNAPKKKKIGLIKIHR